MDICMTIEAYENIKKTIGQTKNVESGGIIGSSLNSELISEFIFDEGLESSFSYYKPDNIKLNMHIRNLWTDVEFKGIIHSHIRGSEIPSSNDCEYIKKMMLANNFEQLYSFIVMLEPFTIVPYVFVRSNDRMNVWFEKMKLIVCE